jgi:hypothetical protein
MRAKTSASQACGSMSFILAVTIKLYITAARSPPRSEPQNGPQAQKPARPCPGAPARRDHRGLQRHDLCGDARGDRDSPLGLPVVAGCFTYFIAWLPRLKPISDCRQRAKCRRQRGPYRHPPSGEDKADAFLQAGRGYPKASTECAGRPPITIGHQSPVTSCCQKSVRPRGHNARKHR